MKTKDTNNLQIFQHFIAKHIQCFNRRINLVWYVREHFRNRQSSDNGRYVSLETMWT